MQGVTSWLPTFFVVDVLSLIHITLSYAITFVRMPWRKDYISLLTIDFRESEFFVG